MAKILRAGRCPTRFFVFGFGLLNTVRFDSIRWGSFHLVSFCTSANQSVPIVCGKAVAQFFANQLAVSEKNRSACILLMIMHKNDKHSKAEEFLGGASKPIVTLYKLSASVGLLLLVTRTNKNLCKLLPCSALLFSSSPPLHAAPLVLFVLFGSDKANSLIVVYYC